MISKITGEVLTYRTQHSVYFINVEYWGLLLLAAGGFFFYRDIQSGSLDPQHLLASVGLR